MKAKITTKYLSIFILISLFLSCNQKSSNPENEAEETIIISSKMPQGDTLPKSAILDTLIYQSHVELILSSCYNDTSDPDYPEIIYLANNVVKTFAFVWLPENWDSFSNEEKRMIIHLHGHCGIGTKRFCEWYNLARIKNIAVLSLQYWMGEYDWCGGNPKPLGDYSYYITGPGQTCGWHLNIENDIYPFISKLAEYFDVHSIMLHGFSMAAATGVIVDYRDKQDQDIIDLTVFNAGHIDSTHYFYKEIESCKDSSPFKNENYFFFLENIDPNIFAQQSSTRSFLIKNGVKEIETVIAVDNNYKHGALLNNEDFLPVRERIVSIYDSITTNPLHWLRSKNR